MEINRQTFCEQTGSPVLRVITCANKFVFWLEQWEAQRSEANKLVFVTLIKLKLLYGKLSKGFIRCSYHIKYGRADRHR